MKLTILGSGTSQGIPVIGCDCHVCKSSDPRDNRLRTSAFVEIQDQSFVIDVGPDFRQQMLNNSFHNLDAILITHEHNDHVIGLDDVRPINFRFRKSIPILGLKRTLEEIRVRFPYAFANDAYPGVPRLNLRPIDSGQILHFDEIDVNPIQVMHGELPILGYIFSKNLAYLTDVKYINDTELLKLRNIPVLIINALHHREHHSHLNLKQAVDLIKIINPQKAYLTHLSHQMGKHTEVQAMLPENIQIAYDGLEIEVDLD